MRYFRAVLTTNDNQQGIKCTVSDNKLSVDEEVEEPYETVMSNNKSGQESDFNSFNSEQAITEIFARPQGKF